MFKIGPNDFKYMEIITIHNYLFQGYLGEKGEILKYYK